MVPDAATYGHKKVLDSITQFLRASMHNPPEKMADADAVMNDVFKAQDWDLFVEHNLMGLCMRIGSKHVLRGRDPALVLASPQAYAEAAIVSVPGSYELVQCATFVEAEMPNKTVVIVKHRFSPKGLVLPHSSLG
jgi:hypothetical protein